MTPRNKVDVATQISILSPVFNEERHIREMIHSVQSQTHTNWQLVLVDDGSTDRTPELIHQAASRDPRIVVASTGKKLGKAAAFNLALHHATGEIICLLAGDDRVPPNSLEMRVRDLKPHLHSTALSAYKLRSFSAEQQYDNMTLPRGDSVSLSGGSVTMTRKLANAVFPIPESLPSEDIWIGRAAPDLAETVVRNPRVVLEYRIHRGNSNPRHESFPEMSASMAIRHEAWKLLAESALQLSEQERAHLKALYSAEKHRRARQTTRILLSSKLSISERLSIASMSHPTLFRIRTRFYRALSGRQGR